MEEGGCIPMEEHGRYTIRNILQSQQTHITRRRLFRPNLKIVPSWNAPQIQHSSLGRLSSWEGTMCQPKVLCLHPLFDIVSLWVSCGGHITQCRKRDQKTSASLFRHVCIEEGHTTHLQGQDSTFKFS